MVASTIGSHLPDLPHLHTSNMRLWPFCGSCFKFDLPEGCGPSTLETARATTWLGSIECQHTIRVCVMGGGGGKEGGPKQLCTTVRGATCWIVSVQPKYLWACLLRIDLRPHARCSFFSSCKAMRFLGSVFISQKKLKKSVWLAGGALR